MATTDIFANAAAAFRNAGSAYNRAAGIYGTPQLTGNPALASAYGFNAASAVNPNLISQGINRYMNPYTSQVINRTSADISRMARQQDAQNAAAAVNAGAFGGGRHGVVDAITASEAQKNIGDISAQLRSQGFETAAGLSAQDIANRMNTQQFNANLLQQARQFTAGNRQQTSLQNAATRNQWEQTQAQEALSRAMGLQGVAAGQAGLGQTQFGIGQAITGQQAQQGQQQQDLVQSIMDLASGQFQGWTGQPTNALNTLLASLGMNPLTGATKTTQSNKPGLFDWASLIGQSIFGG